MRRVTGSPDDGDSFEAPRSNESQSRTAILSPSQGLAAGIHEVQNALSSALFSVDVARRTLDVSERGRALDTIERAIDRSRTMLSALADPVRRFDVQGATLRMAAIAEELIALLQPRCAAFGIELFAELDGDPRAWGDRARVVQILTNLVLNGLDAVLALDPRPEGRGRLVLSARERDDGACEFVLTDDGVGMTEDTLRRLFEPGYTSHPEAHGRRNKGTGLGMSVSRILAQAMGGDLTLASVYQVGTVATLRLPRGAHTSASAMLVPASDELARSELPIGMHVLVVDDEPSIRELLVTAFSLRGATVHAAAGGDEARELLATITFDVALIDETLGRHERGADLVTELASLHPTRPVLLMTGAPSVEHLQPVVSRFLLRKPFSLDEAVRAILAARAMLTQHHDE
ncbi:MAG: ATP-binding protein [Deltaproteobacteria bacterium]|nr:ATP-binding protein [Deltaproteobacteria bacterium]